MPFIENEGQVDGTVAFYAKTFGGTVYVTHKGEIVYSLPKVEETTANELRSGASLRQAQDTAPDAERLSPMPFASEDAHSAAIYEGESPPSVSGVALKETLVGA